MEWTLRRGQWGSPRKITEQIRVKKAVEHAEITAIKLTQNFMGSSVKKDATDCNRRQDPSRPPLLFLRLQMLGSDSIDAFERP